MQTHDPQAQRELALEAVNKLRAAGYDALFAGGCVRDQLIGRTPKDYDVATNARPDAIRALFGKRRTIPIGAAFGVITLLGPGKSSGQIDIATFRQDAKYTDGRHPDAVVFSTAEVDAQRRDFTINGLFCDPTTNEIIDYVGGRADLDRQIIRAIGDAKQRIAEDKLRMLRAVRFAATFNFRLDPDTEAAIQSMSGELKVVSVERIAAELRTMLVIANRSRAVKLLDDVGLLAVVLPEVTPADRSDDWQRMLDELATLDAPSFPLALAVLLHRFADAETVSAIGTRWKLANREIDHAVWLVQHKEALCNAAEQPWPSLQRLLIEHDIGSLLSFHVASHPDGAVDVAYCREKLALPAPELNPAPLITGDDLKAHGIPPGKIYQSLLDAVRNAQLEKRVRSKEDALTEAMKLYRG